MKLTEPLDAFSIEDSFVDYISKVYKEPPSKGSAFELRMAFFAGAYQVRACMEVLKGLHHDMRVSALNRMDEDILNHLKEIMVPADPKEAGNNGDTPAQGVKTA